MVARLHEQGLLHDAAVAAAAEVAEAAQEVAGAEHTRTLRDAEESIRARQKMELDAGYRTVCLKSIRNILLF